jgi:hypothetical protein
MVKFKWGALEVCYAHTAAVVARHPCRLGLRHRYGWMRTRGALIDARMVPARR